MRFPTIVCLALCALAIPRLAAAADVNHYIRQGDRYFQAGDYGRAAGQFWEGVEKYPGAAIPRLALGHTFFAMRQYRDASRSLRDGIHLRPSWSRSGINLRGFFRDPWEFDSLMGDLAYTRSQNPTDPDILFLLAYCRYFSGQPIRAMELFRELLEMAPNHEAARTFY